MAENNLPVQELANRVFGRVAAVEMLCSLIIGTLDLDSKVREGLLNLISDLKTDISIPGLDEFKVALISSQLQLLETILRDSDRIRGEIRGSHTQ
ncbi:MAG: hypothetical protein OXH85_07590 [Truepera sp.]|nr:hypothetical protein [Truepera sp.]